MRQSAYETRAMRVQTTQTTQTDSREQSDALLQRCLHALPAELGPLLDLAPKPCAKKVAQLASLYDALAKLREQLELFEDAVDLAEVAECPDDLDEAIAMLRKGAALVPVSKLARRMKAEIRRIAIERAPVVARLHHDRVVAEENRNAPICSRCQIPMQLRRNRADHTLFWGCTRFPACRYTSSYVGGSIS